MCSSDLGRLVIIATLGGAKATFDASKLMRHRQTLTGSTLRPRSPASKATIAGKLHQHVWPLFAEQRLRPVIHEVFPAADAARAHTLMESSTHIGKIMLRW